MSHLRLPLRGARRRRTDDPSQFLPLLVASMWSSVQPHPTQRPVWRARALTAIRPKGSLTGSIGRTGALPARPLTCHHANAEQRRYQTRWGGGGQNDRRSPKRQQSSCYHPPTKIILSDHVCPLFVLLYHYAFAFIMPRWIKDVRVVEEEVIVLPLSL
jgi:hypothetical protein